MENALQNNRTLDQVASEIRTITASMLVNIIEIGRRMVEAKEMLPYGEFGNWIKENTGYSLSTANNFMRLFDAYGSQQQSLFGAELEDCQTFGKLSYSKALALLALPDAEARAEFIQENDVENMTTRELQEALKKAEDAEKRAAELEAFLKSSEERRKQTADAMQKAVKEAKERTEAAKKNEEKLRAELEELKKRPVDVAVETIPDKEAEAKLKKKLDEAVEAKKKAEEKLKDAQEEARKDAEAAEAEAKRLSERVATLEKQAAVSSSAELTTFKVHFEAAQGNVNAMIGCAKKLDAAGDGAGAEKLRGALRALLEKSLEVL